MNRVPRSTLPGAAAGFECQAFVVAEPHCGQRKGRVIAMSLRAPVMMNGNNNLGIFLAATTLPWFWHLPGLVWMDLSLLAVITRSFSALMLDYLDCGVQRNLSIATSRPTTAQAAMISRSRPANPVPGE